MNQERILSVLQVPHTSEKTTRIADKHKQITFKVLKNATKDEIKASVEQYFNVKVASVTVVNVKGKTKRFKQTQGKRSNWKKAYVTLLGDSDIQFTVAE